MTDTDHDTDDARTARIFTLPFDDRNYELRERLRDEPGSLTSREFSKRYQFAGAITIPADVSEYPLNYVWGAWNHGSGRECRQFKKTVTASLSVGDVIYLDDRPFVCMPIGWSEITLDYQWYDATPPAELLETLADMRAVNMIEHVEDGDRIVLEVDASIPDMIGEAMARAEYHFYEATSLNGSKVGLTFVSDARMDGLLMTENETREELFEAFHSTSEQADPALEEAER